MLSNPATGEAQSSALVAVYSSQFIRANGLIEADKPFPSSYHDILEAYGIEDSDTTPGQSRESLESHISLIADISFRMPVYHVAIQSQLYCQANILVYEMQFTNPYPRFPKTYKRANHAANDVFLFSVAPDLVPELHLEEFTGAVKQLRDSWLDFCHGKKLPWGRFQNANCKLGPVFTYANEGKGRECGTIEEAVDPATAARWRTVLGLRQK